MSEAKVRSSSKAEAFETVFENRLNTRVENWLECRRHMILLAWIEVDRGRNEGIHVT